MKGQAVPSGEQHQRKEARRKELLVMLTRRKREKRDWDIPRKWRAAIYLREPGQGEVNQVGFVPSIHYQGVVCRCAATVLHAEVIGEFVDELVSSPSRPGLRQVLELAQDRRLEYLLVSSLDRLVDDRDEALEIGWMFGLAGTVVISADGEKGFPWTGITPPDQE